MSKILRQTKLFCKRNASTILTCAGGAGVVTTTVLAVKATPKALMLLEEAKQEKGENLTKFEVVLIAGPAYIPTVVVGVSTLACIFGANALSKRQQASLMSAYALLDSSYKEYKEKVKELHGEELEKEVREELAQDKFDKNPVKDEDDGKQLFYDELSQRFFKASNETILSAEYAINKIIAEDCYATLNELYDLFEIPTVDYGDTIGWSSAQMFEMFWSSWIDFWHEKSTLEDGTEYFTIHFTEPVPDFADY